MSTPRKSIAERTVGNNAAYAFPFGTDDPGEIAQEIKKSKASHTYAGMRLMALNSIGAKEHPNPEYLIITGCVRVFDSAQSLGTYFRLLERLDVSYTILRVSEYCSNLPGLHTASTEESWEQAWEDARELSERNHAQARPLGVKHLVYFCSDGYAVAQRIYRKFGLDSEPLFYLDILWNRLGDTTLRVPPTTIGFFPGCWQERRLLHPDLEIRPKGWRQMLERIEGVRIVNLSARFCCKEDPAAIVEQANDLGVERIVTPCNGVGQAKFRNLGAKSCTVADLLFEALPDQDPSGA